MIILKDILKNKRGFTLIESMVAVAIFSVVVSLAAGGFVQALQTQRRLEGLIAANSNAGLVMEQMAREIRTGRAYCADDTISFIEEKQNNPFYEGELDGNSDPTTDPGYCFKQSSDTTFPAGIAAPVDFINFRNAIGNWVEYRYDSVARAITREELDVDTEPVRITASNVDVDYMNFTGIGWGNGPTSHSRVTILLGVSSREAGVNDIISHLQTTVSSRGGGNN